MPLKSVNGKLLSASGKLTADADCCCPDEDTCELYCPDGADYDLEITLPDLEPKFPETQTAGVESCCQTHFGGTYTLTHGSTAADCGIRTAAQLCGLIPGVDVACSHCYMYCGLNTCLDSFPTGSCTGCASPECAECGFIITGNIGYGREVGTGDKYTELVVWLWYFSYCELDGGIAVCPGDCGVVWRKRLTGWVPCSAFTSAQSLEWDEDRVGTALEAPDMACTGDGTTASFQLV